MWTIPAPGPEARKQPGKGLPTGFPRLCALQIRAQPKPPETGKTRRRKTRSGNPRDNTISSTAKSNRRIDPRQSNMC